MDPRVKLISTKTLHKGWGTLASHTVQVRDDEGQWQTQVRETYDHGNGAAMLLIDPARDTVVLTRQFRLPPHINADNGWLIEICAGLLDGDAPETCAIRESIEETGYRPTAVFHAFDAYMSPGSLTEKIHCFVGHYDPAIRDNIGGGLEHEGEDIEVLEMAFADALAMIETGEIIDGKTIMMLQHVALHRQRYQ